MNVYRPRRSPSSLLLRRSSTPNYSVFTSPNNNKQRTVRNSFSKRSVFFSLFSSANSSFLLQILGLFVLSVALLLSFQSLAGVATTSASAQQISSDVRIYNNFQQQRTTTQRDQSQFISANPVPESTQQLAPTKDASIYTVQASDTLVLVSQKFSIPVATLAKLNNLTTTSALTVGDQIRVK